MDAQSLKLVENGMRIQIVAACLSGLAKPGALDHQNVTATFAFQVTNLDRSDPRAAEAILLYNRLRFELLRTIAERDSKLALEFLRATRQEPLQNTMPSTERKPRDQELWLELSLAAQIAPKDSKTAVRIAEASLGQGLFGGVIAVVDTLRQIDRKAASDLAVNVIRALKPEELLLNPESANAAGVLLKIVRGSGSGAGRGSASSMLVDEQSYRDLVNAIASAVASLPSNKINQSNSLFNTLHLILPETDKLNPSMVEAIRQRNIKYEQSLDPRTRTWKSYESLMEQGTVDALAEAAAKAPPEVSDELYSRRRRKPSAK